MSESYIVKNQQGYFASKHKEWLDGREPRLLFRSPHKDEAVNLVFEMSAKDINVRAEAICCELDDKKNPIVEVTVPLEPEEPTAPETEAITKIQEQTEAAASDEPREETASERLSKMAARLREAEEQR